MKETYIARQGDDAIDPKFFNLVSQIAHFFATYSLTFTAGKFWGWWGIAIVGGLCVIYAAWHEFYWDPKHENPVTRGSDLEDFVFLVLGVLAAAGVYAI